MEFTRSQKGAPLLVLEGYTFRKKKAQGGRSWWCCTRQKALRCTATAQVDDASAKLLGRANSHNHHPENLANRAVKRKLADDSVAQPLTPLRDIYW